MRIINQYKDMRREMGFEIRSMWFNLGQNKVQFVPSLVGLILEMTLIPESELRKATIPIFFDMMQCEFYSSRYEIESFGDTKRDSSHIKANFSDFENEMIVKLDALFEGGKGDVDYKTLFHDIMIELCAQHTTMHEDGIKFVKIVSRLMESLLEYRQIIIDENKENTMSCTVNLLMWECAIKKCQELAEQYEQETFDYDRLSDLHNRMAIFYDDIMKKARAEPEYFRVGYYGRGFPQFLQNKAELLNKLTPPGEDITGSDKQCILLLAFNIQINKVDPVMDEKKQKFTFSRPFTRKDPFMETDNEFAHLWLERTELTTTYPLPGILRWFPVQFIKIHEISPLRNAIETMERTNKTLTNYITVFNKDKSMQINPLSLTLTGILDAAVMGGIKNYEEVFFTTEYECHHPDDKILLQKLKDLIADQIPLLDLCVQIHKQKAPDNLQPLQKRLEECFALMRTDVEEKYGRKIASPPFCLLQDCDIKLENEVQMRRHYSITSDRLSDVTITPDNVGGRSRVSSLTRSQVASLKNFTSNFNFTTSSPMVTSRSVHHSHSKSLIPSPSKSLTGTPALSHKKSHKTPKEKRRSSKTEIASLPINNSATQWYTSDSDTSNANIVINGGSTPIFELTQELHPKRPLRSEVEREKRLSRPSSGQFSRPNSMSVSIRGTGSSGASSNRDSVGTTDSSISEEDAVPPPLPAKHRDTDYSNLPPSTNENYSFLYSHRTSSVLRNSLQIQMSTTETLEIEFDDSDLPPTPPPKPPKNKSQTSIS
ncbi:hypothetical protein NQ314_015170 [Rhamnusium bicolor]|uniref:DOCKER domain-containing protein n=1 Tax=Rhamnusium bicolor TaxID=1586634 RepID=A0AAV8X1U5_9CUCU|nr:hypothetical protein NQ314_015170 [Rhamnusium bicolor]